MSSNNTPQGIKRGGKGVAPEALFVIKRRPATRDNPGQAPGAPRSQRIPFPPLAVAMFSALLGPPSPKVEVSLVHDVVALPPNLNGEATAPSLSGVVTVHFPTRRKAERLYVTLEGKVELHGAFVELAVDCPEPANRSVGLAAFGKWPAEKDTVFRRVVELPLGKEELDIGDHV